jgi:hypothetical protein
MLKSLLLVCENIVLIDILHVVELIFDSIEYDFWMFFEVLSKGVIICAFYDVNQLFQWSIASYLFLGHLTVLFLPFVFVGNGVQWPVCNLQTVSIVKSIEISFHIFIYPYFFQHSMQLLFDIDVIFKT